MNSISKINNNIFYTLNNIPNKLTTGNTILVDLHITTVSNDIHFYLDTTNKNVNITAGYYLDSLKVIVTQEKNEPVYDGLYVGSIINYTGSNIMTLFLTNLGDDILFNNLICISNSSIAQINIQHKASACYAVSTYNSTSVLPNFYAKEIMITQHQPNTYYANECSAGYIGLVINTQSINFSIWDSTEGPSVIVNANPNAKVKYFSSEGSGAQINLDFPISVNKKYTLVLKTTYDLASNYTYYRGHAIDTVSSNLVYLGLIKRPGKYNIDTTTLFIENPGGTNGHILSRRVKLCADWTYGNNNVWSHATTIKYINKDNLNSYGIYNDGSGTSEMEISIGANMGISNGNLQNDQIVETIYPALPPNYLIMFLDELKQDIIFN